MTDPRREIENFDIPQSSGISCTWCYTMKFRIRWFNDNNSAVTIQKFEMFSFLDHINGNGNIGHVDGGVSVNITLVGIG